MAKLAWQQWAALAGSAAAAGLVAFYLFKNDSTEAQQKEAKKEKGRMNVDEMTKADVLEILQEILKSQESMKTVMKSLTQDLIKNQLTLNQTYHKIKVAQPEDPLEKYGVTMADFDVLLEKHQHDPNVRDAISQIMGAPSNMNLSPKIQAVTRKTIVQIHEYMLGELKKLVEEFQKHPDRLTMDARTLTMTAQAIIGARVESKFALSSDEIESAVLFNHASLVGDSEFARVNVQMQQTMSQLMGSQFPVEMGMMG